MLRAFADVGIAFMELLEVQAKRLGAGAKRVAAGIAVVSVAGILAGGLLLGGTGFLVWALYLVFLDWFTPAAAAAFTGLAIWIVIGVGGWIALSMFRRTGSS